MGTIAMLHPGMPGVMISTREGAILPRLNERGIVGARLEPKGAPEGSPMDWRVFRSFIGINLPCYWRPAACIHMTGSQHYSSKL